MKIEHLVAFGFAGQPVTCPAYSSFEFPSLHQLSLFLLSRFDYFQFIDSFSVFTDNNRYINLTRQGYTMVYSHDWTDTDKMFVSNKGNFKL